ncbi:MAG TPA: RsmG family class I SAM-dependent methyltransferase [Acidimicrobiia bacterium]|nr:RsmG family class I SAM-dependent methyltransferase [Acidimicrobiia bacterium]
MVEDALGHAPGRYCDLGTGGGVPGLVLARAWAGSRGAFVDSSQRRGAALRRALDRLNLAGRVEVVVERAEVVAQDEAWRESFDAVTARSFAPAAATAEIAAGLVAVGGVVVVSEPPAPDPDRWPEDALLRLGFGPATILRSHGATFATLRKVDRAPSAFPRPSGRPTKRPLW